MLTHWCVGWYANLPPVHLSSHILLFGFEKYPVGQIITHWFVVESAK